MAPIVIVSKAHSLIVKNVHVFDMLKTHMANS